MKYCFGVDIGGTTVKLGIFEEEGRNIEKWEIPKTKFPTETSSGGCCF